MKIKSGRYTIEISSTDKILFGKSGITKGALIDYYQMIVPVMMPHVDNCPISMERFPEGIQQEGFFQKDAGVYFPSWITCIVVPRQIGGVVHYVVIDKPATLIYLANQNCITPHTWLSRADDCQTPDRMIFDLDPADSLSFKKVQRVAILLKEVLDFCQLPSFCMLTGSRGAHIVIPLKRVHSFEETGQFAFDVATLLAEHFPKLITIEIFKKNRGKRVFLDWLRNGFGATSVAPYAVRAREGAPVAMPVSWQELLSPGMYSQKYTLVNTEQRIKKIGDIWKGMWRHAVSLKRAQLKFKEKI